MFIMLNVENYLLSFAYNYIVIGAGVPNPNTMFHSRTTRTLNEDQYE